MNWHIFFHLLLNEKEIFFEFISVVDENIFDSSVMSNMFILIRKFNEKHKKMPTLDTLQLLLDRLPELEKKNIKLYSDLILIISKTTSTIDIDIFKEEMYRAIQNYEMEKFILKSANRVGTITFEDVLCDVRKIANKFKPKSTGIDVTDVKKVIKYVKPDQTEKVTSGVDSLNKLLYGGFGQGEFGVVMAPPGRGKSFFLLNMMYGAMLSQYSVLYLTFELYEKSVVKRLYSRISYSNRKEMLDDVAIEKAAKNFFSLSKSQGRIIYFPSRSLSIEGLESLLEQQETYYGFVPQLLVVDYLDLLAPNTADYRLELRQRLRNITEDLRSLAVRRHISVFSATQANRASLAKMKITEANVSESFGKIEVSDIVLAFCQTDEEKQMHRARIVVLKNRDYVSGGCIEVFVDFEKMLLMDLDLAGKMGLLEEKKDAVVERVVE